MRYRFMKIYRELQQGRRYNRTRLNIQRQIIMGDSDSLNEKLAQIKQTAHTPPGTRWNRILILSGALTLVAVIILTGDLWSSSRRRVSVLEIFGVDSGIVSSIFAAGFVIGILMIIIGFFLPQGKPCPLTEDVKLPSVALPPTVQLMKITCKNCSGEVRYNPASMMYKCDECESYFNCTDLHM
jgi:hypothetical protein